MITFMVCNHDVFLLNSRYIFYVNRKTNTILIKAISLTTAIKKWKIIKLFI